MKLVVFATWLVVLGWLLVFEKSELKRWLSGISYTHIKGSPRTNRTIMLLMSELGGKYELGFIVLLA